MARRNPADGAALDPALTQKKRARRRLVGALVLGVAAAIVLPLVLDSEPRQTISDVEIEIPPREAALPPVDSATQPEVATAPHAPAPADDALLVPPATEPVAAAKADPREDAKANAKAEARSDAKADARSSPPQPRADAQGGTQGGTQGTTEPRSGSKNEASKVASAKAPGDASPSARAESSAAKSAPARSDPAAAAGARYALQVGAFANAGSARAQLDKARRTGLRAYTETVNTAQGERTRVRVGPFPTREEAEKARATLKLAGIDSAVVDAR